MVITDAPRDFNQKYGDCIVRASYKGAAGEVYQIHSIDEGDSSALSGHMLNESGTWIPTSLVISDTEIDFTIPNMGMINVDSNVIYVRRTTTKQYRQAFTFKNSVVVGSVIEHELANLKGVYINVKDGKVVKNIFDPVYYSLEESLERIYSGEAIASAITSRYYVSVSPYLPFVYLGFMGKVIGKIERRTGGCFLYPEARPLTEDVSQYITIAGECNGV